MEEHCRFPLAAMLMVAEMTGNLSLLAPAMIAVSLSYLLMGKQKLYISQLETRADSPAHRLQLTFPLLSTLTVRQALTPLWVQFTEGQTIAEAETSLVAQNLPGAPVLDEQGKLVGVLTSTDVDQIREAERIEKCVGEAMHREALVLDPDKTLDEALEILATKHISWAPVSEGTGQITDQQVIGVISVADMIQHYRETSKNKSHYVSGMVEGEDAVEADGRR